MAEIALHLFDFGVGRDNVIQGGIQPHHRTLFRRLGKSRKLMRSQTESRLKYFS
jgi:hypothetical protein